MPFEYVNQEFSRVGRETIGLSSLAQKIQAPFYFYDGDEILERASWFKKHSRAHVHFAMKSNSEIHVLRALASQGFGVDVVSFGEVEKALKADFQPSRIIYSGVAKSEKDLIRAIELGIGQINVESLSELNRLKMLALNKTRPVSIALRINLAMDVPTHPYIQTSSRRSKFGLPMEQLKEALALLKQSSGLQLTGLTAHVGSQIMDLSVFRAQAQAVKQLIAEVEVQGFQLKTMDLGGGLGIDYSKDQDDEPRVRDYLQLLSQELQGLEHLTWLLEPGRILTARPGVLIAKVEYVKKIPDAEFLILNTGTHHLLRPALYGALHRIQPLKKIDDRKTKPYDVVGLLCESSDCFAKDYAMPEMLEGEWLAIREAGAYGHVMASCYNESPLPREIVALNGKILGVD